MFSRKDNAVKKLVASYKKDEDYQELRQMEEFLINKEISLSPNPNVKYHLLRGTPPAGWLTAGEIAERGVSVKNLSHLVYQGKVRLMKQGRKGHLYCVLESAPFTYAARSRRTASVNFPASVRASSQVLDT